MSHLTHYRSFRGRFYRPDDQTNIVKALKETSWSSRSGLNPTRTTPPCYNNTTLGNRLYAGCKVPMWQTQSVGPVRTAHISVLLTVNTVSHNPTQSSCDNTSSDPPGDHHNSDVAYRRGGVKWVVTHLVWDTGWRDSVAGWGGSVGYSCTAGGPIVRQCRQRMAT